MCPTSGGRTLPVKVNVFQKPKYIIYCLYRLLYISFIVYIVPFANAVSGTLASRFRLDKYFYFNCRPILCCNMFHSYKNQ